MGNFSPNDFRAFALLLSPWFLLKLFPITTNSFDFYRLRVRGFESFLYFFNEFVNYFGFQNKTKRDNAVFSGFLTLFLTLHHCLAAAKKCC